MSLLDPFSEDFGHFRHDFILHARTIDCDVKTDIICSMAPGCSYCVNSVGLRMLRSVNDAEVEVHERKLLNDIFPNVTFRLYC